MIIVISGPLPVKLPIKNLPQKIFIAPKDAPWNFRGSPLWQFLNTMITREDMDEIDLSGTKVPKKSATVKNFRIFSSLSAIVDLQLRFDIKANKLVTTSWLLFWCYFWPIMCVQADRKLSYKHHVENLVVSTRIQFWNPCIRGVFLILLLEHLF